MAEPVRTADFHFDLPPGLIAQHPAPRRDGSRLLVFHRPDGSLEHRQFPDLIEYLRPGDVLVLNDSRVLPARLRGTKPGSGGAVELLLVRENSPNDWWVMLRPGKRVRAGTRIRLVPAPGGESPAPLEAEVREKNAEGHCRVQFLGVPALRDVLEAFGEVPLPPYIERAGPPGAPDRERYQTVFAHPPGSVAAPTAGLHFTSELLERIRVLGVEVAFVTLHVGLGTFAPVKAGRVEDHVMHEESYELPPATAARVNAAKAAGRRVVAVGTTTVRVLESCALPETEERGLQSVRGADAGPASAPASASAGATSLRAEAPAPGRFMATGQVRPGRGNTRIFIHPPRAFAIVDALLTNFHLPESTLLMLVSAFAAPGDIRGRETVLAAYAKAVRAGYRFFSYGDAMLLL